MRGYWEALDDDDLQKGDHVLVESLTGEQNCAVVVRILEETAGEHLIFEDSEDATALSQFWEGTVDDEAVVRVRFLRPASDGDGWVPGQRVYSFPESRIEPDDRSVYAQLSWNRVVDEAEVARGSR